MNEQLNILDWGWKGTKEEWREIVTLEYVLSQGYEEENDEARYIELHQKGWFSNTRQSSISR